MLILDRLGSVAGNTHICVLGLQYRQERGKGVKDAGRRQAPPLPLRRGHLPPARAAAHKFPCAQLPASLCPPSDGDCRLHSDRKEVHFILFLRRIGKLERDS
ncbi:hypothetical protein BRADI_4g02776v3 [Brachypodium distachyon]|uniref:Uncharacterized protein n=1 Tax=Brachypodium distachyon TaxID=15368 RepID=A0A2K2CK56_BRADI|nr:hypothetical protein BRADI_4g02776v3 [Brachypodium distachyon]